MPPPPDPPPGHGPFGDAAFRGALVFCVVLVAIGLAMMLSGGEDVAGVGTALLVLAGVGLLTGGAGLALERLAKRRQE